MATDNNLTPAPAPQPESEGGVIDFGKIFRNYLRHWWWFAISLVVCLGLAFVYLKKKSPLYLVKSLIMLNQEEVGGVGAAGSLTSIMNLMGQSSSDYANPENEIMKMESQTNLTDVVNALQLQYNYWSTTGILKKKVWLYKENPVAVNIPAQILDTISVLTKFHIEKEPGEKDFRISVEQKGKKLYDETTPRFPYTAKTPYGSFTLTLTKDYNPQQPLNLYATATGTASSVDDLRKRLSVSYLSKKADAIQIDVEDVNIERGEDVVNAIMRLYNGRREADRKEHNQASLDFINNRLMDLYAEIDEQDSKVEHYKKENRIVDAEAEATYIFTRMSSIDEQYVQLKTRVENYMLFRDMLSNPGTRDNQIPFTASELSMSEAFAKSMISYNDLLNQRMNLEATAKAGSRQLDVLNRQIDATRENILKSLGREIQNTNVLLGKLQKEINERDARMAGMPAMEHKLLSFERDRVVKNQIYAYLLQKREETQIALSQHEPVGKIIDAAYPELAPVAPNKRLILGVAFVLGLMIPAISLQMRAGSNESSKQAKA